MSSNRGKRGRPKKFAVSLKINDEAQLRRTLDLSNVGEVKPCINDIIGVIVERLEREEAAKSLALAEKWRNSRHHNIYGLDGLYPGCDDEDYDIDYNYDPYEEVFDGLCGKNSKRLKRLNKKLFGKGSKKRYSSKHYGSEDDDDYYWKNRHSLYSREDWDDESLLDDEDSHEDSYKCIKFYEDIENELSCREFDSLKSFSDFCGERGYILSTLDYNNLLNLSIVHCCLDPLSLENGDYKEVITDSSYGGLYWTVSDDMTKANVTDGDAEEVNDSPSVSDSLAARTFTD